MSEELAILLGQEVVRQKAVELPPTLPMITNIPSPHQVATVPAGDTRIVFRFNLPKGCVGFILRIANVYYPGDIVRWKIDGKEVDIGHIRRVIGSINLPTEIVPWFRMPFHVSDVWEVENKDTEDHDYEVLNEGFYIEKVDLPLLLKLAGVKG